MLALLTLALGFASAAGYQIVARRDRPSSAFHGASPVLLFGIQLVISVAFGIAWLALGSPDPSGSAVGFLIISATLLASYFIVVWLFGVRSGAVTWREMGVPVPATASRLMGDIGLGVATMFVVWPLVTILTGILALLLNSRPPDVVPPIQDWL